MRRLIYRTLGILYSGIDYHSLLSISVIARNYWLQLQLPRYWLYPATSVRCLTQAAGLASPGLPPPLRRPISIPNGLRLLCAAFFAFCPARPSAVLHFSLTFFFLETRSVPPRTIHSSPSPLLYIPLPFSLNSTFIIHIGGNHHSSHSAES